jgi:YYY domain-containing protein
MSESRSWWSNPSLWLVGIVLFAAAVRLPNMAWDQNHFFHPDERAVAYAVQRISFSDGRLDPDFFAYGSLPIYLAKIASNVVALVDPSAASYDGVILNGRRLSGVIGVLSVYLLFLLGSRLYDRSVGLLAAFLLAASALHVQSSRFLTVDVPLTFFVLLGLTQLVKVCEEGKTRQFLAAGVCLGLAVATKFSAMPLFLPLGIAALHRYFVERRFFSVAGRVLLALFIAAVAFAVAEPYAILRFDRFYHDIFEQSHMVRNAGAYPYTTQYMGTRAYVYELTQLVLWGMAPLLGVVAIWATATRVGVAWRSRRAAEWVLLSWVIPFFLVTGWFEVKFPRYLLPIYPLMALWAADWLLQRYRRGTLLGRIALPAVVLGTLAATLAFVSTYTRPHTVVTASEWFYQHVPPESKVLTQDWDEGFPFSLPGYNPGRYQVKTFGYYEDDTPAKIQRLSEALASSDYVIFQTKRLYGAVTRVERKDPKRPERRSYPLTSKYFYQLFAGDLGYKLIHEVASRPSLFGIEVPDELADESLTVYDHPKVLFFQNTEKLDAAAIADRILNRPVSDPTLTRDSLLLARPSDEGGMQGSSAEPIESSLLALLLFALLVEVLSLAVYPVLRRWLTGVGALALSKTLGVLLFAYVSWIVVGFDLAGFTQGTLTGVLAIFVLLGIWAWRHGGLVPMARGEIIATEALFWGAFAFFLVIRAYNPAIYWGEKPMDFSFLNALTRSPTLPPPEPWFSGSPLHYSYFGYYVVAALGKVLHLDPALTFNLGIALVAGLTAAAAFAVGALVAGQWQAGLLAAFLTVLIGNLAGPRELMGPHPSINFDYFWATSRVIRDTINEFPFWSFLFADLHAHVMVMPFSLTFLGLAVVWVESRVMAPRQALPAATPAVLLILLALSLGAITVTNTWSAPTYVLFFVFLLGTVWLTESDDHGWLRFIFGGLFRVLLVSAVVIGGSYVLYWPYWRYFVSPERNFGWERLTPDKLAQPFDSFTIFGLSLFILVPFVLALWGRLLRRGNDRLSGVRMILVLAAALLVAGGFAVSTRAGMAILFLIALQLLLAPATDRRWRIPLALTSFAFAVTAGTDLVYVWDRMNTIFKFYLEAWFMFTIAAAVAGRALWSGLIELSWFRRLWQVGLVLLMAIGMFTAVTDVIGVIRTRRVETPTPSLDGMAYLRTKAPDELAAFDWLNRNVKGIPVIVEAHGDGYQEFTRVSMNTGLPTVLGWGYHVYQRAHSWPDINRRKADIQTLYTTEEKETAAEILQRYHVALVFVGALERRTYAGANLERFGEWHDVLTPIYQNPGVSIFAVNGQFSGAMPVTTIEDVAGVAAGEEAPKPQDTPGQVQQPRGIAITPDGDVVVCDFGNNRIQVFKRDLAFLRGWGKGGELPSQFNQPGAVAVAPNGEVYVADTWNHRVQVFSKEGKYLREFAGGFYGPRGIAIDPKGTVFVADTGNNRIIRFTPGGQKELEWGGKGDAPGKFWEPTGIAADAEGKVYVADNGNGRLQIFTRDGQTVAAFAVPGWESKVFSEPHVTIDPRSNIWVTVPGEKEIRRYDRLGQLLATIKGQTFPSAHFETPMGIAYSTVAKELVISDLDHRIVRIPYAER